jgi:hypothetical protein
LGKGEGGALVLSLVIHLK